VALQVGDQLGHRLLGDLRPLREHTDAGAGAVEVLEHVAVRRADLGVPALGEAFVQSCGRDPIGLAQQDSEVVPP
jgi:hypothetical protein